MEISNLTADRHTTFFMATTSKSSFRPFSVIFLLSQRPFCDDVYLFKKKEKEIRNEQWRIAKCTNFVYSKSFVMIHCNILPVWMMPERIVELGTMTGRCRANKSLSFIFFKKYSNMKIIKRKIFNIYRLYVYEKDSQYLISSFSTLFFCVGIIEGFWNFIFIHRRSSLFVSYIVSLSPPIFSRCFMFRFCLILYTNVSSLF